MRILITSNTDMPHHFLWQKMLESEHEIFIAAQHSPFLQPQRPPAIVPRVCQAAKMYSEKIGYRLSHRRAKAKLKAIQRLAFAKYFQVDRQSVLEYMETPAYREFVDINSSEALDFAKSLSADLVVVQGGAILSSQFYENAKYGTLHLHGGIVPFYRGGNTWYPNLVNNDLHYVGPTVQELDSGIDTGNIIHQHSIRICVGDTPWDLYCKTIVVGIDVLLQCVSWIDRFNLKIPSTPVHCKGFNFSAKRLKQYHEIMVQDRYRHLIAEHVNGKFSFTPRLVQRSELMVNHQFVAG